MQKQAAAMQAVKSLASSAQRQSYSLTLAAMPKCRANRSTVVTQNSADQNCTHMHNHVTDRNFLILLMSLDYWCHTVGPVDGVTSTNLCQRCSGCNKSITMGAWQAKLAARAVHTPF